ncbi:MAG: zinc-dependent metalloprotease [Marinifilaceae bacterium]|jgi:hypothetical protein|nr:zinc-dependent metalloprotease [Marinifilaceae bacterium]
MRKLTIALLVFASALAAVPANAQFWKSKKKKAKEEKAEGKDKKDDKKKTDYDKLIKDAKVVKGLFNIILKKNKIYLEIPKKEFDKDMLVGTRVLKVSDNENVQAGRMTRPPVRIQFTADTSKVYVMRPDNMGIVKDKDIRESYDRNNITPIWFAYELKCYNADSTAVVADFTKFFYGKGWEFDPFVEQGTFEAQFNPYKGTIDKGRSRIEEVKSFPQNLRVNLKLGYTIREYPFTALVSRQIVKMPEKAMKRRWMDERFGYFEHYIRIYDKDGAEKRHYAHKWNLEPKDKEAYLKGELVEPVQPIVWYVDNSMPEVYKKYIKQGIEDWKPAFEEIGFKNAIIAKDYPTKEEDPNFDPDDIRYNCYRYVPTTTKNSMGPSWIDPRSGQILGADVLFFSNVVKLLNDWRFIQTAQVDERVRTPKVNDELIGKSLRYVAAHEIGHTLGLMHNFMASTTYPVDSLRSATFTQKYGTTPSIMDYARYNYVAQPGDKGLRLSPPNLGIYDKFQIKLAYQYYGDDKTSDDVYKEACKLLQGKSGDLRYTYLNPYTQKYKDALSNTESVGDDMVKASKYGVKNLKFIEKNLAKWLVVHDDDYKKLGDLHTQLGIQWYRYMNHVIGIIGGQKRYPIREGYKRDYLTYVPKANQKAGVKFILKEIKSFPVWYNDKETVKRIGYSNFSTQMPIKIFERLFGSYTYKSFAQAEFMNVKNRYTYRQYQGDIFNGVWESTIRNRALSPMERLIQYQYVTAICNGAQVFGKGSFNMLGIAEADEYLQQENICSVGNCNCADHKHDHAHKADDKDKFSSTHAKMYNNPVLTIMTDKTLKLLKAHLNSGNEIDRNHYRLLYNNIVKFQKNFKR